MKALEFNGQKFWKRSFLVLFLALLVPALLTISGIFDWSLTDFIAAALIITGMLIAYYASYRLIMNKKKRWMVFILVLIFFVLLWMELAVGIFNTGISGT